jgi:hypothetical protein
VVTGKLSCVNKQSLWALVRTRTGRDGDGGA